LVINLIISNKKASRAEAFFVHKINFYLGKEFLAFYFFKKSLFSYSISFKRSIMSKRNGIILLTNYKEEFTTNGFKSSN
jgi:hypothetical protein